LTEKINFVTIRPTMLDRLTEALGIRLRTRAVVPPVRPPTEVVTQSTALSPDLFERNYGAGATAKGQELNPGALNRGEHLLRLVELDEEVVAFQGSGDQAVGFISAAQKRPVEQVNNRRMTSVDGTLLARTGVEIVLPFTEGEGEYLHKPATAKPLMRAEVVGLTKTPEGKFNLYLMLPAVWSIQTPSWAEVRNSLPAPKKAEFVQATANYLDKVRDNGYENPLTAALVNPAVHALDKTLVEHAVQRGAFIKTSGDNGQGFLIAERRPHPTQDITRSTPVAFWGLEETELKEKLSQMVVSERVASALPR
jgi:hypothetical protein